MWFALFFFLFLFFQGIDQSFFPPKFERRRRSGKGKVFHFRSFFFFLLLGKGNRSISRFLLYLNLRISDFLIRRWNGTPIFIARYILELMNANRFSFFSMAFALSNVSLASGSTADPCTKPYGSSGSSSGISTDNTSGSATNNSSSCLYSSSTGSAGDKTNSSASSLLTTSNSSGAGGVAIVGDPYGTSNSTGQDKDLNGSKAMDQGSYSRGNCVTLSKRLL